MKTDLLNGKLFAKMLRNGAANLNKNRVVVNELNVFPIPDGDTGDNMYMTVRSGADAVRDESSLSAVADAAAKGMLLGARGNSGVILSRIFAGIAKGVAGLDTADVRQVASAMLCGVKESYGAVAVPMEGTVLTVFREGAEVAGASVNDGTSLEDYFDVFNRELRASLERTPDLLAVLKEAGVVDSGGAGFVFIAEGMDCALRGGTVLDSDKGVSNTPTVNLDAFGEDDVMQFGYCTEFLLRLTSSKVGDVAAFDESVLSDYLHKVGESVVAFRDGSIFKAHVHTMTPGEVLSFVQQFGEFLTVKIENMMIQHEGTTVRNGYEIRREKPHKAFAAVAVAAGEGLKETFLSLGADAVVDGGQSMNPSAEDFLKAFSDLNADNILVFPNNSNIVLTAEQAASMFTEAKVTVVRTKTVGEGYAALSMLDTSSGNVKQILSELGDVIRSTVTGEVSKASRTTEMNGVMVVAGDYIGFSAGKIYNDDKTAKEALLTLAEKLSVGKYDVCLLLCGKDSVPEEAQNVYNSLQKQHKSTEFIMVDGGQPIYDYILILE